MVGGMGSKFEPLEHEVSALAQKTKQLDWAK